mgnify:CR=1 FL=1|jgi:hypothetical protein
MITRSRRQNNESSESCKHIKKSIPIFKRKKKRRKKLPPVPRYHEGKLKPIYQQNSSPPSPISPRFHKFPSSSGMSPRIGSSSVAEQNRIPPLALGGNRKKEEEIEFRKWKENVDSHLCALGSPRADDLPDCNLRDMFDQCVRSENAARVVFRKKIFCDDFEDADDAFDEKEQNSRFRDWKSQVDAEICKRLGGLNADVCRDVNWRDMYDQGVRVESAVCVAEKIELCV